MREASLNELEELVLDPIRTCRVRVRPAQLKALGPRWALALPWLVGALALLGPAGAWGIGPGAFAASLVVALATLSFLSLEGPSFLALHVLGHVLIPTFEEEEARARAATLAHPGLIWIVYRSGWRVIRVELDSVELTRSVLRSWLGRPAWTLAEVGISPMSSEYILERESAALDSASAERFLAWAGEASAGEDPSLLPRAEGRHDERAELTVIRGGELLASAKGYLGALPDLDGRATPRARELLRLALAVFAPS